MPLDFPSSPAINDTWTGSNGAVYTWDGVKWVVSGSGAGPYLPLAGGTMTGALALAADPTTNPQAANKHYVDQSINLAGNYLGTWSVAANTPNISAGGSISNANYVATTVNPATPEVAPAGIPGIAGMTIANGDRIIWAAGPNVWQILRNAGLTLAAADARYVALGGSTMTGALTLSGNAASALQAVPLQQVPVASSTTPAMDGTATIGAGTTWARADHIHPTDTSRASSAAVAAAAANAANNVGRNLIHNALFNVVQRGTGPWTVAGYTVDRWQANFATDAVSFFQNIIGDVGRATIGDDAAYNYLGNTFTGNAAAGAFNHVLHKVENVTRLGGKTVTISFWALATAGTPKLGVSLDQFFGTGGSPSATVQGSGTAVTLSTTWTRYSVTLSLATVVGKVLGTANDHFTALILWYSSGATNATRSGNVGVQSGQIHLWGVQLEVGTQATPLDYGGTPQQQFAECQRFYQASYGAVAGDYAFNAWAASAWMTASFTFSPIMRAVPTIARATGSLFNVASDTPVNITRNGWQDKFFATAAGATSAQVLWWTASADL